MTTTVFVDSSATSQENVSTFVRVLASETDTSTDNAIRLVKRVTADTTVDNDHGGPGILFSRGFGTTDANDTAFALIGASYTGSTDIHEIRLNTSTNGGTSFNRLLTISTANADFNMPVGLNAYADATAINAIANPVAGQVVYNTATGSLFVRNSTQWTDISFVAPIALSDLSDVTVSTPTQNSLLVYDTATGKWRNQTVITATGVPEIAFERQTTAAQGGATGLFGAVSVVRRITDAATGYDEGGAAIVFRSVGTDDVYKSNCLVGAYNNTGDVSDFVVKTSNNGGTSYIETIVSSQSRTNINQGVLYVDKTNSRVGVNDTTPAYTLDVNGTVNATTVRANESLILNSDTVSAPGAISISTPVTALTNTSSENFTLALGAQGQTKVIVRTDTGSAQITVTNAGWLSGTVTGVIALNSLGATVTLIHLGGKWYVMGSRGTITLS